MESFIFTGVFIKDSKTNYEGDSNNFENMTEFLGQLLYDQISLFKLYEDSRRLPSKFVFKCFTKDMSSRSKTRKQSEIVGVNFPKREQVILSV